MRTSSAVAALGAAALAPFVRAQCEEVSPAQYAGTPFDNSLTTTHELSEITYFKIRDPTGQHVCTTDSASDLSLLNYMSLNSTGGRIPNADLHRIVFSIHGARNDPWNYHAAMIQALEMVDTNDEITPDTVGIISPYFPNNDDAGTGYPFNSGGASIAEQYPSRAMVWYDTQWSGGSNNQYPPSTPTVSVFDVLDQIVQYYGNADMFPNIKQIVVAGHSMGAQLIHRYAAVGLTKEQLGVSPDLSYWVGDPSSYVWPATTRPLSTSKCPDNFDDWREGLNAYAGYGSGHSTDIAYNLALVQSGRDKVLANYQSKTVNIARATLDKGDYSEGLCAPYTTGQERNERMFEFIKAFPATCDDPAGTSCKTIDLVVSTHDAPTMYQDVSGRARLFNDNWAGNGGRAYDFGYPRHSPFDDPHPDPAHSGEALIHHDAGTYAGGMTHRGCWTDVDPAQSIGSLPVIGYVGADNSRSYCANLCNGRGYHIAGVSDQHCYCGNALGSQTVNVVTTSCESACPAGVEGAICGGPNRLSIFANIDLPGQTEGT